MLCYNTQQCIEKYVFPHIAVQMKVINFFFSFVAIAVFFDSNSPGTNFDISSTQRFCSKDVSFGASTDKTCIFC